MLTCRKSPLWQCCEHCSNVLSSFWLPWIARTWSMEQRGQRGHYVTCALIGKSCKWPAYNYVSSLVRFYELVDASSNVLSLFWLPWIARTWSMKQRGQKTIFCGPVLAKGFLQLSPEVAMLPGPRVEICPPHPVPPFMLVQNLSPKYIAGSDITSWKLYDAYMCLSCIIS